MADIPEGVKKLAEAAVTDYKANLSEVPTATVRPGFVEEKMALVGSARSSLVVETPAAAQPSVMDTDALTKAREAKRKSVWEEQVSQLLAKEAGNDKRDHDLDR